MSHSITFGTDGWRAIIAEEFTFANVERVAYAAGLYVKQQYYRDGKRPPVLIGYDTRFLADKFAKRVAQVLIGMGVEAKMTSRDVPTPVIAWATQLEPTAGALQLTASHNPPEYCGIKYIPDYAGPATNEITNQFVSFLDEFPVGYEHKPFDVPTFDPRPAYFEAMDKKVNWEKIRGAELRVACDTIYSTSRDYLDTLLIEHGVEVKTLHNWRDPLFGGGMPEPKPENLVELIRTVKEGGYDIGCSTDGDADRFGVVDEKGNYYMPNQMLCLLTRHLVKNYGLKGTIVRTVATTHLLDRLGDLYGLDLVETPVGFKYIGEQMRLKDVLIGGEESGGVSVKGHIPEKDGIMANLLTIEMMAFEGKALSEIWEDLQKEVGIKFYERRRDLKLTPATQHGLMERLSSKPFTHIGEHKVEKVGLSDGLKFFMDQNTWVLVRPSGTEPLVRLYFEGTNNAVVEELVHGFEKQVNDIIEELNKNNSKVEARA